MDSELRREVEDFLYFEADLLDDRKLREWVELFTEDARYWMPIRHNTFGRPESVSEEISKPGESYYFDDDKATLRIRVERLYATNAWAEMPPSRTRHFVSNVRVKSENGVDFEVHSNFIVYRTRMETDQDLFVGTRQDILHRGNGAFKIARRTIILDQAVLAAKNISVFF